MAVAERPGLAGPWSVGGMGGPPRVPPLNAERTSA
jgi:hypothetical protein